MSNYVKVILDVHKSFQEAMLFPLKFLFKNDQKNQRYAIKSNSDEAAIRGDWERIGSDLRRGILTYDRQLTK